MSKLYDLVENILLEIEEGIREGVSIDTLTKRHDISDGYLRSIFRFAFKQSLASYIRSRKLTASIDELLKTKIKLIDIAVKYGFEYEQSYIRSFKREFKITPGDLRKTGEIVKIKPPLQLFNENKLADGLFFMPDIVLVPQFHVIGKHYRLQFDNSVKLAPEAAKEFWKTDYNRISNKIKPNVYIGLTKNLDFEKRISDYYPSVQVSSHENIPEGLIANSFDTSLCVRFRYIGQHHYYDLDRKTAGEMYEAIRKFTEEENASYVHAKDKIFFERIDTDKYDGTFCQLEWFTPILMNGVNNGKN